MARTVPMGNDRIGPVAEWPTRGRCNVLFPRFALTGYAWRSLADRPEEACPAKPSNAKAWTDRSEGGS
jgi:hypothetical protein